MVAVVTDEPRMVHALAGQDDLSTSPARFLASNGADQARQGGGSPGPPCGENRPPSGPPAGRETAWRNMVTDLNVCSQQGLAERFDSTIGAATVLMPFGGELTS